MNTAFPTLQLQRHVFLQRRGRRRWSGLGLLPAHVLERTAQVPLALLAVALVVQAVAGRRRFSFPALEPSHRMS